MIFLLGVIAASALGIIYWAGYFIRSEVRRYKRMKRREGYRLPVLFGARDRRL